MFNFFRKRKKITEPLPFIPLKALTAKIPDESPRAHVIDVPSAEDFDISTEEYVNASKEG